jgi:vitamin B12 transporter
MKCIAVSFAALIAAAPCFAAEAAKPEEIVVTATRTPEKIETVGAAISVVSRAELDALQALAVADVLKELPGVGVSRNGGHGGVTSVRIRGAEADQTILLIDGVKLNDPASPGGGFNFANLLVGDLDRVEVLRRPQSTLYGSQAIGGVVNLITRSAAAGSSRWAEAELGERGTSRVRAGLSGAAGRLAYSAALGRFETDGVSAAASGREEDGYLNEAASGRAVVTLAPGWAVDLRGWWARGDVAVDGFPPPAFAFADTRESSTTEERILYAGLSGEMLDGRLQHRLGHAQTRVQRENFDAALAFPLNFVAEGENARWEYQAILEATQRLTFVAGAEREEAQLSTHSPSAANPSPAPFRARSEVDALFVQVEAQPTDELTATLGLRRTEHDRFGENVSLRATLAYALPDGRTRLRASAGEGFKAPTPFQLFSDFGNPLLKPERAFAWDAAVTHAMFDEALTVSLGYFARDAADQIDFVSCFANRSQICVGRRFGVYDNVARARAEGVEAEIAARFGAWRAEATATWLDAVNRSAGAVNFGRDLPRRPEETLSASLGYTFAGGHEASVAVSHFGAAYDDAANRVRLDPYMNVALRGSLRITDRFVLYARVENATDETQISTAGYGFLPRQAFLGVRARY